uniref:DUF4789 domain-containing protein n=1 Tax=Anopheles atroparvus TaxID=41427 RepID=A0AAG5CWU2_ANOAO
MERTKSVCATVAKLICLAVLIVGCCSLPATDKNSTDIFAYPAEQSAVESKQNARNRTPIYIPKRCGHDEILYPGDHETDWVCDCKPTYVYHAASQKCYQMYTKGFCDPGKILYIAPNGKVPECIDNRCGDGKVAFKNDCVVLNKEHHICYIPELKLKMVVGINEETHNLECINISAVPVNSTAINDHASQNFTG